MTEYCKPFHLSKWDKVVELFKPLEDKFKSNPNGQVMFISKNTLDKISELIIEDVDTAFNRQHKLVEGMMFCQPSRKVREHIIHVDGTEENNLDYYKFAINIPILNCDQGEMVWYGGDYDLRLVDGQQTVKDVGPGLGKYHELVWKSEPVVIHSKIIDTPHIVKIDVPHQVINHSDNFRVMLTTRFTPDITI